MCYFLKSLFHVRMFSSNIRISINVCYIIIIIIIDPMFLGIANLFHILKLNLSVTCA